MNAHEKTIPVRAKRRRSHHPPRPALTLPSASNLPAAPIRPPAFTLATAFALAAVVLLAAIAAPARADAADRGVPKDRFRKTKRRPLRDHVRRPPAGRDPGCRRAPLHLDGGCRRMARPGRTGHRGPDRRRGPGLPAPDPHLARDRERFTRRHPDRGDVLPLVQLRDRVRPAPQRRGPRLRHDGAVAPQRSRHVRPADRDLVAAAHRHRPHRRACGT